MNILCVCQGGNVRSAALSRMLKDHHRHNSVQVGWEHNLPEPITMLCRWADVVVVMEAYMVKHIPAQASDKIMVMDVGPDLWHYPSHPDLVALIERRVKDWKATGWRGERAAGR